MFGDRSAANATPRRRRKRCKDAPALAAVERVVLDGRYRNFNLAKNYWLPGAALESQSAVNLNAHPDLESIAHSATFNNAFHLIKFPATAWSGSSMIQGWRSIDRHSRRTNRGTYRVLPRVLWQFCGNSLHKLPQIGPNRTFRETRPASLLTRGNGIEFTYLDGQ